MALAAVVVQVVFAPVGTHGALLSFPSGVALGSILQPIVVQRFRLYFSCGETRWNQTFGRRQTSLE